MVGQQPFDQPFDNAGDNDGADPGSDVLAAFDYPPDYPATMIDGAGEGALDAFDEPHRPTAAADGAGEKLFTVTNPPGTVSVSALIDGSVHRIGLSAKATDTTEQQLAAEIVVIAGLASQQARSAQFSYALDDMRSHGHDEVLTAEFLTRSVGLPSPQSVDEAQAQVFSDRYRDQHE